MKHLVAFIQRALDSQCLDNGEELTTNLAEIPWSWLRYYQDYLLRD